jgi:hypothetical protein
VGAQARVSGLGSEEHQNRTAGPNQPRSPKGTGKMTFLTFIALIATLVSLAFGIGITLGEAGYSFDLRRRSRRKAKDGRVGGRRAEDQAAAA